MLKTFASRLCQCVSCLVHKAVKALEDHLHMSRTIGLDAH